MYLSVDPIVPLLDVNGNSLEFNKYAYGKKGLSKAKEKTEKAMEAVLTKAQKDILDIENERTSEFEYMLQQGRSAYLECQADVRKAESDLRTALNGWEFDRRRQHDMMEKAEYGDDGMSESEHVEEEATQGHQGVGRGQEGEEGARGEQGEQPNTTNSNIESKQGKQGPMLTTEVVLSRKMGEVSAIIYEMLSKASFVGSAEPEKQDTLWKKVKGFTGTNKKATNEIRIGLSSWDEIRKALWGAVAPQLMTCLDLLFETVGVNVMQGSSFASQWESHPDGSTALDVVNVSRVACQITLYTAVEKIMSYHWETWRRKQALWADTVSHHDLTEILEKCEQIMYRPPTRQQRKAMDVANASRSSPHSHGDVEGGKFGYFRKKYEDEDEAISLGGNNNPLILKIQEAVINYVDRTRTPRSDLLYRTGGATEACMQS